MKAQTEINYSQAVKAQKENKKERLLKYKEFKDSICDLFDMRDFYYYAEVTGLKIETILSLAKFSKEGTHYCNIDGDYILIDE